VHRGAGGEWDACHGSRSGNRGTRLVAGLPLISGAQAVKAFERAGWHQDRQRGSHVILIRAGHIASLSVPQHRELAPGTLRALIRAAGMSVEEFVALL
jgi:predicted RNA binding protein YcfA (HicA-like mRNA interferase family)